MPDSVQLKREAVELGRPFLFRVMEGPEKGTLELKEGNVVEMFVPLACGKDCVRSDRFRLYDFDRNGTIDGLLFLRYYDLDEETGFPEMLSGDTIYVRDGYLGLKELHHPGTGGSAVEYKVAQISQGALDILNATAGTQKMALKRLRANCRRFKHYVSVGGDDCISTEKNNVCGVAKKEVAACKKSIRYREERQSERPGSPYLGLFIKSIEQANFFVELALHNLEGVCTNASDVSYRCYYKIGERQGAFQFFHAPGEPKQVNKVSTNTTEFKIFLYGGRARKAVEDAGKINFSKIP